MRKILTALVTVAAIGATTVAMSSTAEARWRGRLGLGPWPVCSRRRRRRCGGRGDSALLLSSLCSVSVLRPRLPERMERLRLGTGLLLRANGRRLSTHSLISIENAPGRQSRLPAPFFVDDLLLEGVRRPWQHTMYLPSANGLSHVTYWPKRT